MARLYDWAADILCFLVLMSLLEALLPSKKYVRYIRFFAGVVLILVTAQPLLNGLGIAQEMDRYFGEFSFQTEARDIRRDVLGIEEERRDRLLSDGEKAAAGAVEAMAREQGFIPVRTKVVIEKDAENANYGAVVRVTASVRKEDGMAAAEVQEVAGAESAGAEVPETVEEESAGLEAREVVGAESAGSEVREAANSGDTPDGGKTADAGDAAASPAAIRIEPVKITPFEEETAGPAGTEAAASLTEKAYDGISKTERGANDLRSGKASGPAAAADGLAELKRRVEDFYELESENVEIQLEGERQ